jgi:tetraacyldisaccharide 4'-kinase
MINPRAKIADYLNRDRHHKDRCLEKLLGLLARGYSGIVSARAKLYRDGILASKHAPCPVISVGNLTVGGTGKTPMTIYLAALLQSQGYRVAIISRGYGGRKERSGGIVSDGRQILLGYPEAGDEPLMMALKLPDVIVAVGQDRHVSIQSVWRSCRPDVILLDDGFQHLRIARQINLMLMDYRRPLGNGHTLPRGPLREPVSALQRSDAICFTRTDVPGEAVPEIDARLDAALDRIARAMPVFYFSQQAKVTRIPAGDVIKARNALCGPRQAESYDLAGKRVFAFSGIGNNDAFRKTIVALGATLAGYRDFGDHHRYRSNELRELFKAAARHRADGLATTEKDIVRLPEVGPQHVALFVLGIELTAHNRDDTRFDHFVLHQLKPTACEAKH